MVALRGVAGPQAEAGCQAVWREASRGKAARWGALPAPVVLWGAWYLALAGGRGRGGRCVGGVGRVATTGHQRTGQRHGGHALENAAPRCKVFVVVGHASWRLDRYPG